MNAQSRQPTGSITGLRGGLGRNLLTAFLLLTLVPLGANAWLVVNHTNHEMRQATQDRLSAIVTLKTAQIDGWLAGQERNLAQVSAKLAATPATATLFQNPSDATAATEVQAILRAALDQHSSFQAFHLLRPGGEADPLLVVTATDPTTTLAIQRAVPVPGSGGERMGQLVGYLNPAPLVALVVDTPALSPSGRAYLVAPSGQAFWLASASAEPLHSPGIEAALSGTRGSALYTDYQGQPVVGAYDWHPSLGLAIIVEQPQSEAFAPAENLAALLIANTLVVALLTTLLAAVIIRRITRPIVTLTMRAVQIADGDFWQTVPVDRRDEIGILAQAFNIMAAELCQFYDNLQGIVAERTRQIREANRQLQHYTARLTLSAEVGRIATSILDPDTLLEEVTTLIHDSYEFSYVGIFLLDETSQQVTLRSSAGPNIEGWALPAQTLVGDETPIGQAAADGQSHLVRLAPTYVECAIPLRTGQQTLGVLDLWAHNPDAFSENDVRVLQSLGDQISVAIVNANAYAQARETTRKLRQLERLRVQSLGSMSHELATALNSIIGFSRLILKGVDGPLTDLQRTDLTAIHQSGHHLLSMMDNVLDLVDLERGTLVLDIKPLDISNLIEGVLTTMQALSTDEIVPLRGVVGPDLPTVLGDSARLRQVLIHLIAEAAESAETVMLSAHTSNRSGQTGVLFRIVGLSDHATPPLPTVPAASADGVVWDEEGASLGLALSKRIIELHGGRMWTQPAPRGSRVYVLLLPGSNTCPAVKEEIRGDYSARQ